MFEEQQLNPDRHQRGAFTCGIPALDDYLHRLAVQQSKKGLAAVRVLVDPEAPQTILGFYKLSAAHIEVVQLREAEIVNVPFLGVLAGCSARRSERRVASHTSEEQRSNAPVSAATNGIFDISASLSDKARQKLPRYPVPCFLMGRFAVASSHQSVGIGKVLMGRAVARCLEAKKQVAAYALLVDAKDESAKAFYLHYGFMPCREDGLRLYLPLGA